MNRTHLRMLTAALTAVALATTLAQPAAAAWRGRGRGSSVRTEHKDTDQTASGTITALKLMQREITVGGKVFNVPGSATITINGAPALLGQIKVGEQATVQYKLHTNIIIRSGGSEWRGGNRGKGSRTTHTSKQLSADAIAVIG